MKKDFLSKVALIFNSLNKTNGTNPVSPPSVEMMRSFCLVLGRRSVYLKKITYAFFENTISGSMIE